MGDFYSLFVKIYFRNSSHLDLNVTLSLSAFSKFNSFVTEAVPLSYKNQYIDLLRESMDCFLYDNGLRHERVKEKSTCFYFINGSYNRSKSFISNHLERLNRTIDEYSKKYQNLLFLRDCNATTNKKCMEKLCNLNELTSLIKKSTCFKNPDKPTCINLILTNEPNCFQHSNVSKTGLSDFHLLTVTEFRMSFKKLQPKIINHRDYKNFGN